jgi:hypothetical protein
MKQTVKKSFSFKSTFVAAATAAVAVLGMVSSTYAANYTLWVNGRTNPNAKEADYTNFAAYWGPATTAAGVNKKAVNWDGKSRISDKSYVLQNALDCFCTGSNWCYLAGHSAGNYQIGYTLAMFGGNKRQVKNAIPNTSGVCNNVAGNTTQTGWNIKWVNISAGAAGGSELSDVGSWAVSEPLVADLKTKTARAMYDHNLTRGLIFNMYTGAKGTAYSFVLPGQDDEAVSYHSSGGVAGAGGTDLGNPSDWLSNDLTLGTAANEGGSKKWTNHTVKFRDDKEAYDHYNKGNWQGVTSLVRADVVLNAK